MGWWLHQEGREGKGRHDMNNVTGAPLRIPDVDTHQNDVVGSRGVQPLWSYQCFRIQNFRKLKP